MAGEIQLPYGTSGATLYAVVRNSAGQLWNGSAFEAYTAANWTTYAVTMTEQGASGFYVGNFPVTVKGVYNVEARQRAGGSPAVTDPPVGGGSVQWNGSALVIDAGSVDAYTADEALRLMLAVLAGKLSGAGTGTETFRNTADNKNRVVSTVDDDGNRSAVTLDAS